MNLGSFIIIMIIQNYDYHPYSSIIMIIIHSESWSMAGTCLDATAATGKSPCAWSPIRRGTTSPWDDGGGGGLSFFSGDPMWIMWLWLKIGCFKTPQLRYIYIYMLHMFRFCFQTDPFAGFLVQKSDSGFSCLSWLNRALPGEVFVSYGSCARWASWAIGSAPRRRYMKLLDQCMDQ